MPCGITHTTDNTAAVKSLIWLSVNNFTTMTIVKEGPGIFLPVPVQGNRKGLPLLHIR
jgi:hypothetical protein